MWKTRGVAAATAIASAVLIASPASASVTNKYSATDNPGGNDGAGQVWGSVKWRASNSFFLTRTLKDVCPGDDKKVFSTVDIYADVRGGPDDEDGKNYYASGVGGIHGGVPAKCGDTRYFQHSWPNTQEKLSVRKVWRLRIGVRVEGGKTTYTPWFDNPYNNDPTRTGK